MNLLIVMDNITSYFRGFLTPFSFSVYIAKVINIDVAEVRLQIIVSLKGSRIGDANVKILNLAEPEKFGCPTMKRGNQYIFFTRSSLNDVTRILPIDAHGMQPKQLSILKYFCGL